MKGRLLVFLLILCCVDADLYSQNPVDPMLRQLKTRGEVYVSMRKSSLKAAAALPRGVSIGRISDDSVFFYFHPSDTAFILAHLDELTLLTAPSKLSVPVMADTISQVLNGTAYPTWDQYLAVMQYFRDNWPQLCTIDTIGRSSRGKLILCAVINKGSYKNGEVPDVFFSSSIHGDEVTGYSLMLRLIDYLLVHNDDTETDKVLQNKIIRINPLSNPDGTYYESDTSLFGAIRANARLTDLNRNYPDPQNGGHPDGKDRQAENVAMMNYMQTHPPNMSANFHAGAQVFNYPFDTWPYLHADDDWFRFIGREYADTATYLTDFNQGVTNGFDWYEVNGGRQDYVTYFLHGREVTIELSYNKMPPAKELNTFWNMNRRSLLNYIRQAGYGIQGHVEDAVSGKPVEATITIPDHDKLHSEVYSSSSGEFFRYLRQGTYSLSVTAGGYKPADSVRVIVDDYYRSTIVVTLDPETDVKTYSAQVEPNPFTGYFDIVV
ncbi:MAG TPA: M14 family zinc carboxypeptidase, partial [Bacteroidales bacterium]|nr:M14 family zinc carboxypeptidase [Bacteroidales bacterium]